MSDEQAQMQGARPNPRDLMGYALHHTERARTLLLAGAHDYSAVSVDDIRKQLDAALQWLAGVEGARSRPTLAELEKILGEGR